MKLDLSKLNKLFGLSNKQEDQFNCLTYKAVDFAGHCFLLNIFQASASCNLKLTNESFDIFDLKIHKILEINCNLEQKMISIKQKDEEMLFKVFFDPYISIQRERDLHGIGN